MPFNVEDVVFLGDSQIGLAPPALWAERDNVGVVRRVLESGDLLIERSVGLEKVRDPNELTVDVGNTVAYSDFGGIKRVLADGPVGVRDFDLHEQDPVALYRVDLGNSGLTFGDFGGYRDVVDRANEIIDTQLSRKAQLDKIGARPIKGVLFTGPPGTGKTLLARIIAAESGADFFLVSGPSIVSKWVGDSEETLRRIFEAAAESPRSIIFFDEIDSLAEKRSGDTHEASKRLVAQLLTLMDGFDSSSGNTVVIAATNRVDDIDVALRRPGRFDWEIYFGMPDVSDRYEILNASMRNLAVDGDMPLEELALLTEQWSAAMLASLWTESALLAASDGRSSICEEDLVLAYQRISDRQSVGR
ncbi:ATP-binding protein [Mycobacterium sp. WMMD1722]|uniref:ATP-binding protein n=1 Tax=Mycobacterium sp. WMMD1722 TaxID=3404117 RepID=UPI003BF48521